MPVMSVGQDSYFQDTLRSAEEGDAIAQFNLALMYDNGEGVPKINLTAYVWFNIAAASGLERAIKIRSVMAERMTPSQIAEAQQPSTPWKTDVHSRYFNCLLPDRVPTGRTRPISI